MALYHMYSNSLHGLLDAYVYLETGRTPITDFGFAGTTSTYHSILNPLYISYNILSINKADVNIARLS